MLKMSADGKSLSEALAAIRSTPISDKLPSPAVLCQGRNLRGSLPFQPASLQPQLISAEYVRANLQQRQSKAAFSHGKVPDVRSSSLLIGQRVRVYVENRWQPGVVEKVSGAKLVLHSSIGWPSIQTYSQRHQLGSVIIGWLWCSLTLSRAANKPSCSSDNCTAARKSQSTGGETNPMVVSSNR